MFIYKQKINFILPVFLEILQRYCKLVILGTLGKPGYTHPKYYHLVENFRIYLQAKEPLQPHVFLEILHRYANFLFWVLWACLYKHTQNGSFNLQFLKTCSSLTCVPILQNGGRLLFCFTDMTPVNDLILLKNSSKQI